MADEVVLYALSTCPVCKRVAKLLAEHGVEHRVVVVDLLEGREKSDLLKTLSAIARPVAFPIVTAGDRAVVGHHPDKIRRMLDLPAPQRKGLIERLFQAREK